MFRNILRYRLHHFRVPERYWCGTCSYFQKSEDRKSKPTDGKSHTKKAAMQTRSMSEDPAVTNQIEHIREKMRLLRAFCLIECCVRNESKLR